MYFSVLRSFKTPLIYWNFMKVLLLVIYKPLSLLILVHKAHTTWSTIVPKSTSEILLQKVQKYYKTSLNLICSLEIVYKYTLCMKGINSEGDYIGTL